METGDDRIVYGLVCLTSKLKQAPGGRDYDEPFKAPHDGGCRRDRVVVVEAGWR